MDESGQQQSPYIPPAQQEIPSASLSNTKKWLILGVGVVIIIILLIVYLTLPKRQAQPVGMIDNQPIYTEELRTIALEQHEPNAITREALDTAFGTLSERYVLDKEAEALGISIMDQEILDEITSSYGYEPTESIPEEITVAARYDVLRNKIIQQRLASRTAYTIELYIAGRDEEVEGNFFEVEKELFAKQRIAGAEALLDAEQRLRRGEAPLAVATALYDQYPDLRPVLAVNGYILQSEPEEALLVEPRLYEYNKENESLPFFRDLYAMQPNEVKRVIESDGSGGYVILMQEVRDGEPLTYDEWLAKKRQELGVKEL